MLEFVKKDKLELVSNKIKNIYDKRVGKDKTTFINNFVDKYKDNPAVYNNDFYKDNSKLTLTAGRRLKIDAMYFYLSRQDIICSIRQHARRSASDNDLEVIDIKEYGNK